MHEYYLSRAVAVAVDNVNEGGGPYGAVVVKENRIIAESGNRVTENLDPTAHAEIMAIRMACRKQNDFQLKGCVLYCSCEPCPMCLGAIYWARLDQVFYACSRDDAASADFDDRFIYDQLALPSTARSIPMRQLWFPEADRPFEMWQEKNDKIPY